MRTLRNLISARNQHLPSVSCIDRLDWRVTEIQATDKERLRQPTISAPIGLMNAAMAIESNESSNCVGCQANFVPWNSGIGNPAVDGGEDVK
jgi:hypothetical protein